MQALDWAVIMTELVVAGILASYSFAFRDLLCFAFRTLGFSKQYRAQALNLFLAHCLLLLAHNLLRTSGADNGWVRDWGGAGLVSLFST